MSETTPRREATRQRLIQAAIGEFARKGIDATSVEQISEAAGFTRGAFYSNFEDKDDLILAILEEGHRATTAQFQGKVADLPDGITIDGAVRQLLAAKEVSPEVYTTMLEIRLRGRRDPALLRRLTALREEMEPRFAAVLQAAADRLGLEPTADIDVLIDIFDALHDATFISGADLTDPDNSRLTQLIGFVARQFTRPVGE
ncbi:MAG TPA: TetR/AcrR family transcriptional regulator [Arachnia sp.]|nr:TetR/AcrR family transcriptional regulator [Arachnia sp.]HMR13648.1 TetR/AcrR family transcriptional regulator [Arachnia sp.]